MNDCRHNSCRRQLLLVLCVAAGLCIAIVIGRDYLPGTFRRDQHGFPHGTGTATYHYDSGPLMLKERYVAGKVVRSTWYKPDGTVIATTKWKDESGTGYYLRQDGSIRTKMQYVNGLAHGTAVYYLPDGNVDKTVQFRDGHPVDQ